MKGPGMRIDLDVKRVWKCPQCGRHRKADGGVTSLQCKCRPEGAWMQLQEERRQIKTFPYPADEPAEIGRDQTEAEEAPQSKLEPTDTEQSVDLSTDTSIEQVSEAEPPESTSDDSNSQ